MTNTSELRLYSPDDFYRAYAIAMLNWQHVESALFRLYFSFFESGNLVPISAAYYSLDAFGPKFKLVNSTAKCVLKGKLLSTWTSIAKKVVSAAEERNVLAHLPAAIEFNTDGSLSLVLSPGIFIPPALVRSKKRKYDAAGCENLAFDFESLAKRIDALTGASP